MMLMMWLQLAAWAQENPFELRSQPVLLQLMAPPPPLAPRAPAAQPASAAGAAPRPSAAAAARTPRATLPPPPQPAKQINQSKHQTRSKSLHLAVVHARCSAAHEHHLFFPLPLHSSHSSLVMQLGLARSRRCLHLRNKSTNRNPNSVLKTDAHLLLPLRLLLQLQRRNHRSHLLLRLLQQHHLLE
jgi:hypothetical protein